MKRYEIIEKALEQAIEMGWMTKNTHIQLRSIAYSIEEFLYEAEKEEQSYMEKQQMFDAMQKYYPSKFESFIEFLQKK